MHPKAPPKNAEPGAAGTATGLELLIKDLQVMKYHDLHAAGNSRVIALRPTFRSERLLDLPETGELWIEFGHHGWTTHHTSYYGDSAAIIACGLPDRISAIRAALAYALTCVSRPDTGARSTAAQCNCGQGRA